MRKPGKNVNGYMGGFGRDKAEKPIGEGIGVWGIKVKIKKQTLYVKFLGHKSKIPEAIEKNFLSNSGYIVEKFSYPAGGTKFTIDIDNNYILRIL